MSDRRVVQNPDGGWDVRGPDGRTVVRGRRTPRRAMVEARRAVRESGGGRLVVEDRTGRVRQTDHVPPAPGG
ncbi:unannotated protein [freshwater metagenome]|uniref:Unannotated protein n=1 Tax=freshwater metagenome TaxID=449393 RepID=A0A6J7G5S5_9ZZZZ